MTPEFLEKVVLLILTAGLGGFIVPYVMKVSDHRKNKERLYLEALIARQAKVIDAQAELLDRFSDKVWELQLMLISVTYYHDWKGDTINRYASSVDYYHTHSDRVIGEMRAEISKAIRLASPELYQDLKTLFYDHLMTADQDLRGLIEFPIEQQIEDRWTDLNDYLVHKLSDKVDIVIRRMADEFNLAGRTSFNLKARNFESTSRPDPGSPMARVELEKLWIPRKITSFSSQKK